MPLRAKGTGVFATFFKDESGFVNAANYLLMTTLLGIGMVAGLTAFRDAVVQELGDFALGLENLDHTYTVNSSFATFGYIDQELGGNDVPDQAPGGIDLAVPATPEGFDGGGGGGMDPEAATPE